MKKKVAPKKTQTSKSSTNEIKHYIDIVNKDTRRYIGALTEDFQRRVSAISEQFLGLSEKIDRVNSVLSEKIDRVNERLGGIDWKMEEHSKKLDTHTQMFGQLMVDTQEIKTDLKQKIDRNEFARLEKRVIALEMRPQTPTQRK